MFSKSEAGIDYLLNFIYNHLWKCCSQVIFKSVAVLLTLINFNMFLKSVADIDYL